MMATVPHVTSGLGLRKFQADGFLLTRVYVRATIVAVEKQQYYYIFWVYVCSLRCPACHAHAPYCHLWPVRLYNIFLHYFIK